MRIRDLYLGKVVPLTLAAVLAAGCAERETPSEPEEATVADGSAQRSIVATMQCTANVAEETLTCGEPSAVPGGLDPRFLIVGGQGTFITLASSNVDYDAGTGIFSADVTVRNLIGQQLGTPDEITFTHVRVFFHSGPNVISGPGPVTVANADGTGVHDDELMTGFIEAPGTPNPLSAITIESLEDLAYSVDPTQADAYMLPSGAAPATTGGLQLVEDIWLGPLYRIDSDGTLIQLLPDRRPEWQRRLDDLWRQ